MDYYKKYIKYKTKYLNFINQKGKGIDIKSIYNNLEKNLLNTTKSNDIIKNNFEKNLLNTTKSNDIMIEKKILNTQYSNEGIIEYNFSKKIMDGLIKYKIKDNNIFFIIQISAYNTISIQDNTLSLPGMSIYLYNKYEENWDIDDIQNILENNKIFGKHIIDIPYNMEIEGVLLKDILQKLNLKNIDIKKFGLEINITDKDYLDKIKAKGIIENVPSIKLKFTDEEYDSINFDFF